MDALENYINRDDRKDGQELIDLALVHYQFEAIHPFNDGNGRIGRLLITLMAQQLKLVPLPLLHISASIEKKKDEYIDRLFKVSTHGQWEQWIAFFFDTVKDSCKDAIRLADETIELQKNLKQTALENHANHRLATLIDRLFVNPVITVSEAQKVCDVSFPTAKSDLEQLAKLEIIEPIKETRPATYVAYPIWRLSARKPN
jgi:Fic family protein